MAMDVMVTGGAGFIGINLVQSLLKYFRGIAMSGESTELNRVFVFDKFTYAGAINRPVLNKLLIEYPNTLKVTEGDICDGINDYVGKSKMYGVMYQCDVVIHLAAESHVDRATLGVGITDFMRTNALGTSNLLRALFELTEGCNFDIKFVDVSTDEVYGTVKHGLSRETDRLNPSSPYSASKAAGDLMTLSCYRTFGLPVFVTRCTNNFGPFQHPEKFIPRCITNLIDLVPIKLYGNGHQIRDWIYVDDHISALLQVAEKGNPGEIYNVGASERHTNLTIAHLICEIMGDDPGECIEFVSDRPGHDERYALDTYKIRTELEWQSQHSFRKALELTVKWYIENESWWRNAKEETEKFYQKLGR
jgi:dTDP-glucose 4,6-dehydratase